MDRSDLKGRRVRVGMWWQRRCHHRSGAGVYTAVSRWVVPARRLELGNSRFSVSVGIVLDVLHLLGLPQTSTPSKITTVVEQPEFSSVLEPPKSSRQRRSCFATYNIFLSILPGIAIFLVLRLGCPRRFMEQALVGVSLLHNWAGFSSKRSLCPP